MFLGKLALRASRPLNAAGSGSRFTSLFVGSFDTDNYITAFFSRPPMFL